MGFSADGKRRGIFSSGPAESRPMSLGWRAESWRAGIRFRWIADRPGPPPQRYFRAITGSTGQLRKSCVSSALHRVHPVCLHLSASLCLSRRALLAFYNRRCPSSNERDVSVSTSTVLPSLQSNTIPCTCVCEVASSGCGGAGLCCLSPQRVRVLACGPTEPQMPVSQGQWRAFR